MSKYLPAALGIAVMLMASTALARERSVLDSAGVKASSASLWEHNGSTLYLVADGATREFHYNAPRAGMLQAGARPGALLFTGRSTNGRYVGTAYIFNRQCGQLPYQVSGPILNNYARVVLTGQAPRVDAYCNILGSYTDILEFSLLHSGRTVPNVSDSYADAPPQSTNPGQLREGIELAVINVGPYDVLKMRKDATDDSPVVDTIPPNGKGVVYLGETQGQWIFVQYDRSNGWVNLRFVTPVASQGGRI
jgi:hypothetical protein